MNVHDFITGDGPPSGRRYLLRRVRHGPGPAETRRRHSRRHRGVAASQRPTAGSVQPAAFTITRESR
jgi:hypothetical protein